MNQFSKPLAGLCIMAALCSGAQAANGEAILADLQFGSYEIDFQTYAQGVHHILRVSCDSGEYSEQRFAPGEDPWFSVVDAQGYALPDGGCSYELRALPAIEGMEGPDGQGYVQFGSLEIAEGQISQRAHSAAQSGTEEE